jgi:hypothetical protein
MTVGLNGLTRVPQRRDLGDAPTDARHLNGLAGTDIWSAIQWVQTAKGQRVFATGDARNSLVHAGRRVS